MSEDTTTYDSTSGGALEASGDDITAQLAAPSFKLSNLHGDTVTRTGDRPSVLCFIKEDCPTCIAVLRWAYLNAGSKDRIRVCNRDLSIYLTNE